MTTATIPSESEIRPGDLPFEILGALYLSPMAGLTDHPYRVIAKRLGADVLITEFASAKALLLGIEKQQERVFFTAEERPVGVQIFGADPADMAAAAKLLENRVRPDFIDINFGCPARKIVDKNGGSGLLRDPLLMEEIVAAVVAATDLPITAKMRIGWERDTDEQTTIALARALERGGARAVAVHGRSRNQAYSGSADWDRIRAVREALAVPVIGNGDIATPQGARRAFEEAGVAAIMVGRGAVGNPWIFREIKHYLQSGERLAGPTPAERIAVIEEHLRIALQMGDDEARSIRELRRHAAAYIKGMPGAAKLRARLFELESAAGIRALFRAFLGATKEGNG
jgi:nifR3 family TIM-barrel protein